MKIELYTFTFNDEKLIPFFLDHYSFVDRMTFIDSGSSDRTLELLKGHNIIQTGLKKYDIPALTTIKNTIWKKSKHDLILFPDLDEIIHIDSDLRTFFETTNADIYLCEGYEMLSRNFDLNTKQGIQSDWYNKVVAFKPQSNIQFTEGSHRAIFSHGLNVNQDLKLLHYKYLGIDNLIERRQKTIDRNPGMYVKSIGQLEYELENMLLTAKLVI